MAGLSLFTGLLVVVALVVVLRDDTHRATPDVRAADGPRPGAAAATLHLLEEAVESHDPDAAGALAPEGDAAAATLLASVADNAEALDVDRLLGPVRRRDRRGRGCARGPRRWR